MKRIGLFGGTFNPIHFGHVMVSLKIKTVFDLDKILIIPSALPPHKELTSIVNVKDRIEMIRLAFSKQPDFTISDVELKRPGPSYTIDTVRHFKSILPVDTQLFLIVGMDAFLEVDTWKSYKDLFRLISFIVMFRAISGKNGVVLGWNVLGNYLKRKISDGYNYSISPPSYKHVENKPVFIFDGISIDISSTKIRNLIKAGKPIQHLVPKIVEDYIKTKGLYL